MKISVIYGPIVSFAILLWCGPTFALDCTVSHEEVDNAWKGSCGLQRGGPQWTGFIQGPLSGAHLSFANAKEKKIIEGNLLTPLSTLAEIPSCQSPTSISSETCKLISEKISLPLPFKLLAYSQDPISFTVGSQWDPKAKKIASGSELTIAACGIGNGKKIDETAPLLYFRKTMDCRWDKPPDHPFAVNCKAPATGGVLQVSSGNIHCELRQKKISESTVVTDLIPVVCIPPGNAARKSLDPITCLGDDRVGFTTQTELREKMRTPISSKVLQSVKGASGINGN